MEKLKKILAGIWKFLNSPFFAIGAIVLLLMIGAGECKRIIDQQQTINQHEQNISALTDSLLFERKKNGAMLVSIDGYIATEKELKTLNRELWERVKGQDGKIISLNHVVIRLQQDSIMLAKTINTLKKIIGEMQQVDDTTYSTTWYLPYTYDSTNFDVFEGRTEITVLNKNPLKLRHKNSYLFNRETQIDLDWGQKIEKGKLRIFVQSAYPGFTVKSMEGVLIDPNTNPFFKDIMKKRHWLTGFGIGPSINTGWNILEAKPAVVIGLSFHYSIYQW